MDRLLVYLHVLAALLFMAAHGATIAVAFRLKTAPGTDAVLTLLGLSRGSLGTMYVAFGTVALSGIVLGFTDGWWRTGWWWASVIVLVAIFVAMVPLGVEPFNRIRKHCGIAYAKRGRLMPADPDSVDPAAVQRELGALRPGFLAIVALGGIAVLVWLMQAKPF